MHRKRCLTFTEFTRFNKSYRIDKQQISTKIFEDI